MASPSAHRFRKYGLINGPNCVAADRPDEHGLYLGRWQGDGVVRKPGEEKGHEPPPRPAATRAGSPRSCSS